MGIRGIRTSPLKGPVNIVASTTLFINFLTASRVPLEFRLIDITQHGSNNCYISSQAGLHVKLDFTGMQDDGIADSDLLFFGYVLQLSSPSHAHSVDNEPNLLLQNATAVFAIVHPQAWLLIFLQI
ncbi:hypothetical protein TNCV_530471 [Trichonephila clavipes]|nr:hypothetical protein TNCV_530471 [Trichonephila clavipes]